MSCFVDAISNRRSVYVLDKNISVSQDEIFNLIYDCVRYVPDAFNMQSQRVIVVVGEKHKKFWDAVYDEMSKIMGGDFPRERTESFAAGFGTILYFYDAAIVFETRAKYPRDIEKFHDWIMQSNGMLQFAIWAGLRDIGIGANLQHYNPVIDKIVQNMFNFPESWTLVAQMPFGGIKKIPDTKPKEDVLIRVMIEK